jgi:hypothetical protein
MEKEKPGGGGCLGGEEREEETRAEINRGLDIGRPQAIGSFFKLC